MTQRRHKPIATPRRKASCAPKKTVRWNEGYDDSKTWNRRHEDNRQLLEEQFSKRKSVSKATKSEYRFCPRSGALRGREVFLFRDRRGAASLCHRNCAAKTVPICEHKPYLVWFSWRPKSYYLVSCKPKRLEGVRLSAVSQLRFRSHKHYTVKTR